jgi:hypothetical protein
MSIFKSDLHVTPAYGRDYSSRAKALADWHAGKDFVVALTSQYISKRDASDLGLEVWIRYDKLRKLTRAE